MAYTTIKKPSDYFNTKLYTGDGTSNQAITGVGFQPDFTWIKIRSNSHFHNLFDVIRGVNKALVTDDSGAEHTDDQYGWLSSFDSDGFTTQDGSDVTHWSVNKSGDTYASWNWLADNTSGSSNTDGSITSTVSANTTSGFSIVSYTGTGANATVGHGLGSTPSVVMVKRRNGNSWWYVRHTGTNITDGHVFLNTTSTASTQSTSIIGLSSSTFSLGTEVSVNDSGGTFIAYCFAEKTGYSKFGSYTGNGNADGTFVYTGFKPAFVMIKSSSLAEGWWIVDSKRTPNNVVDKLLRPDTNGAELVGNSNIILDILSNGFKLRQTDGALNGSGASYIYMAFAEEPLVGDNPATAR